MYKLLLFLLIIFFFGCNKKVSEEASNISTAKNDFIITFTEETSESEQLNDQIDLNKVTLAFGMSAEEISTYYDIVDQLVSQKDNTITISSELFTKNLHEKIEKERSDRSKYFKDNLQLFYSSDSSYYYSASPVDPDGYINFNNYSYRKGLNNMAPSLAEIMKTNEEPFKLSYGLLFFKKDIPVYKNDMKSSIGILKAGSVIRLRGIQLEHESISFFANTALQYVNIKFEDVTNIRSLLEKVTYKLINEKAYRIIDDIQTEIVTTIYTNPGGIKYIRSDYATSLMNGFFCWEYLCDIYFDEAGNFLKYGYDENYGI